MLVEPRCSERGCIHLNGVRWLGKEEKTEVVVCPAFPKGIPFDIAFGENRHLTRDPRQTGDVVYEGPERER